MPRKTQVGDAEVRWGKISRRFDGVQQEFVQGDADGAAEFVGGPRRD